MILLMSLSCIVFTVKWAGLIVNASIGALHWSDKHIQTLRDNLQLLRATLLASIESSKLSVI